MSMLFSTYPTRTCIAVVLTLVLSRPALATTAPWLPFPVHLGSNIGAHTVSPNAKAMERILYSFKGSPDGQNPTGGLIEDAYGSLYGTTEGGGLTAFGSQIQGTVFKLTRTGSGYSESVIYAFGTSGSADGFEPMGGLVMDHAGALYGTTAYGGGSGCEDFMGCGTVFKLTPGASGYTETLLYTFQGTSDGFGPAAKPILDRYGALYGTASGGAGPGHGVVFKLTPKASGYSFNVIDTFGPSGPNVKGVPVAALLLDETTGDLYGTSAYGPGPATNGTVFRLHPKGAGYVQTILHAFNGVDGDGPFAALIMDKAGALYGTTVAGGPTSPTCLGNCGLAFKLTPRSDGYVETVLYDFTGGSDGSAPASPLVADPHGTLYGTASEGGPYGIYGGTAFELIPTSTGYREATLHAFNVNADGYAPSGLLLGGDLLFGETFGAFSGPNVNGTIFSLNVN